MRPCAGVTTTPGGGRDSDAGGPATLASPLGVAPGTCPRFHPPPQGSLRPMAKRRVETTRMSRTLTRAGLWASGPRQLTLPVEARGLSEVTISSGWLQITPDYDVLAWLCERWWEQPTESGWMCPTFYEIGQDLYGRPAGGEQHRVMHEAIRRLAMVSVEVRGFNGETGRPDRTVVTYSHLLEATLPRDDPEGLNRLRVHLSGWLRALLECEALRFSWRTLRGFNSRQLLAKRL